MEEERGGKSHTPRKGGSTFPSPDERTTRGRAADVYEGQTAETGQAFSINKVRTNSG